MKKPAAFVLCLALLLLSVPIAAHATSDDTEVINTHGSRTYMGTASDWSDTWDSDNFTEVTDEDVDTSSDLIIKGGKIGDVSVGDGADLTIKGGTMSDVSSDGQIEMTGGKASSLQSSEDIEISGGTVSDDVESDGTVTLNGPLTVGGTVTGTDVTVYSSSGSAVTVSDGVSFSGAMTVEGPAYSLGTVDGQSSGTLTFEDSSGTLPSITNVEEISLDSGSRISTGGNLEIDTLSISDDSEFITFTTLTAGTVAGPGTLVFNAGKLTVDTAVTDSPVFDLNGTAAAGTTAFKAESGTVAAGDATVFGYQLTKNTYSSGYDGFVLTSQSGSDGVTLNASSLNVASGSPVTVTATVTPALSGFAGGTQLCWQLVDPSSKFTITPNSAGNTCSVSVSDSSATYKATLAAYLADAGGNPLTGYKTALCTLTSAAGSTAGASFTCDTHTTVAVKVGSKYQARITSPSYPNVVAGTGGIVSTRLASKSGNDYYFTFTGVKAGSTGIYIDKSASSVFVCSIS